MIWLAAQASWAVIIGSLQQPCTTLCVHDFVRAEYASAHVSQQRNLPWAAQDMHKASAACKMLLCTPGQAWVTLGAGCTLFNIKH